LSVSFGRAETLDFYLEEALKNSGIENQNKARIRSLNFQKETMSLLDNPRIGLDYGRVKNTGITGSQVGASISQNLPINGKLGLREDGVQEVIHQAIIENKWTKNEFKAKFLKEFLNLWLVREKISHAKHRIEDLGILRKYLTNRKFSSPQQKSDAYLINKKIEEIEFKLNENSFQQKRLEGFLEKISEKKINAFEIKLKEDKVIQELFDSLVTNEGSVQEYRASVSKKSDLLLKEQTRKWIPDLAVRYSYQKENVPGGNLGHAVGFSFNIPIFDTGRTRAEEVRAKMIVQKARWSYEDLRRESRLVELREKFKYFLNLSSGSLEKKEKVHKKELKKIKGYFLKGLVNAQSYLDAEEISHDLHYRKVNAVAEVINVFTQASLKTGNSFRIKEVLK
ncbi:MAG: TolC family protein, partial [Halobacteriovoraceae bacterium]|nr:TolC family protein [Halobacteriovoraceae bacterium]